MGICCIETSSALSGTWCRCRYPSLGRPNVEIKWKVTSSRTVAVKRAAATWDRAIPLYVLPDLPCLIHLLYEIGRSPLLGELWTSMGSWKVYLLKPTRGLAWLGRTAIWIFGSPNCMRALCTVFSTDPRDFAQLLTEDLAGRDLLPRGRDKDCHCNCIGGKSTMTLKPFSMARPHP